jgi:hypothetical protein
MRSMLCLLKMYYFLHWISRYVYIYYRIGIIHHQHNFLLCFVRRVTRLHVSTISDHLQAIKYVELKLQLQIYFRIGTMRFQSFECYNIHVNIKC